MGEFVRLETIGRVATIRIDRPRVNAMNRLMLAELIEAFRTIAAQPDMGAAVIWGGPAVFSAGAEVGRLTDVGPDGARQVLRLFSDVIRAAQNLPMVTVSAVNGRALASGMELAMATDFRVAAENAVFGHPEILMGTLPAGGAMRQLPRVVGVTKAKEIIYTGRNVRAAEALQIGLVSAVHPPDHTYEAAVELAAGYAAGPAALRLAKQAIMDGLALPKEEAMAREMDRVVECYYTEDASIGVSSFLEKGLGKANFTGR